MITDEQKAYLIDPEFIEGARCLELGLPWQAPESIIFEENNLNKKDDLVVEIGTGGSTLFLAKRVQGMIAVETDAEWAKKVRHQLGIDGLISLDNFFPATFGCVYMHIADEEKICEFLSKLEFDDATIFSVDTQGGINRSKILNILLSKGISPTLRMIILDNYGHEGLFPDHFDKKLDLGPEWICYDFDQDRWAGNGTRIYVKNHIV